MPKEVDHPARRRELADAGWRGIARNGRGGTTLAHAADESGWSIGSIRYYFPNKDELVASALWRGGERVDDRIRRGTGGGMGMRDLRVAAAELRPRDDDRREEALVPLAFLAQAAVAPELSDASEGAAQRLQEPLATRIAHLVRTGELPASVDAERAAAKLRVLLDGLRVQLVTTPRQTTPEWALSVLDDYLAALAAPSAGAAVPAAVDSREGRSGPCPLWNSCSLFAPPLSDGLSSDLGSSKFPRIGELDSGFLEVGGVASCQYGAQVAADGSDLCVGDADGSADSPSLVDDVCVLNRGTLIERKNPALEVFGQNAADHGRQLPLTVTVGEPGDAIAQLC